MNDKWLGEALRLGDGVLPFPWQQRLLDRFLADQIPGSLDIPTGLGKTAVIAIWLIARARGAPVPRRLVYVVDRRAVVDQATEEAIRLRAFVDTNREVCSALGLPSGLSLPISTVRGQFVDNREWLEDPTLPAIIVGTVDMIGSRLLFEGYGTSRKMRPYLAGFLGADALLVLDEAHLVPPFERLVESIASGAEAFGPRDRELRSLVPRFRVLSLSATGRTDAKNSFGLTGDDLQPGTIPRKRLDAKKRLSVLPLGDGIKLPEALAESAWKLGKGTGTAARILVFCDKRKDAAATSESIKRLADKERSEINIELFVGGRRAYERDRAVARLTEFGFLAGSNVVRSRPSFVVGTSAGEVGVDLDADHMVSDVVAWERMVQRLGRVNRRGDGDAQVVVISQPPAKATLEAVEKDRASRSAKENKLVELSRTALACGKAIERVLQASGDVSPGALRALKVLAATEDRGLRDILDAASTPPPLYPALSRALADAWSMTSLKEHPGRPEIEPWLRGWLDDEGPQTVVAWRSHLPIRHPGGPVLDPDVEGFFESAPPHMSETLETQTFQVAEWLIERAGRLRRASRRTDKSAAHAESEDEGASFQPDDVVAFVLTKAGDLKASLRLKQLLSNPEDKGSSKRVLDGLVRTLSEATLVVDVRLGGLTDGLLDVTAVGPLRTLDDGSPWPDSEGASTPTVRFAVRVDETGDALENTQWRERFRLPIDSSDDGEPTRYLVVDKWRHDAATEDDRSAGRPQLLDAHQAWAETRARKIADRLALPPAYAEMLAVAARLHDEGKRASQWQRAFKAPSDGIYAKTKGPLNVSLLQGYRHEFGSLPLAEADPQLAGLGVDMRDLALHLIAAHHGFARPVIGTSGCGDLPPSALGDRANEVAMRFERLQRQWGPWGLAWWESLLRAADQQASRDNDLAGLASSGATDV